MKKYIHHSSITQNYDTESLFNQETNTDIIDDNEQVGFIKR